MSMDAHTKAVIRLCEKAETYTDAKRKYIEDVRNARLDAESSRLFYLAMEELRAAAVSYNTARDGVMGVDHAEH